MPARPRISWPLVLLLLSLALTASAVVLADYLERQRARTAQQLLGDYAAFAAWSYSERLKNTLMEAAWQVTNPILHEQPHALPMVPPVIRLPMYRAHSLAQCRCNPSYRPASYFSFTLGVDTVAAIDTLLRPLADTRVRQELASVLGRPTPRGFPRVGVVPLSGGLTGYGLMPTTRPDTIVYGFVFDSTSLPAVFREARDQGDLLPRALTAGEPVSEVISLELRMPDGRLLYRDTEWPDSNLAREEHLPDLGGGLIVRAAVQPHAADLLVSGGLPPSARRLFWGIGGLAIMLALVALVQLRREQALARMRTDFVAAVSHELRTPLAQIRLFLETVRLGRYRNEAQRDWLMAHVDRETDRLGHLVENLLLFTRLDRRVPPPGQLEPVDLGRETGEILDGFAPLAASRRVTFARQLPDGAIARIDRDRYRQMVLNLLDNAVKFGPPGQTVTVQVEPGVERIRIRIRDEGPGIPATERARVWEPFVRGDSGNTRAVGGSGIGLAIVRELAERAGGRALVEEREGPGTTILIELPAAAPASAGAA